MWVVAQSMRDTHVLNDGDNNVLNADILLPTIRSSRCRHRQEANKCRNYYYLVGFVDGETLCGVVSGIRVGDFVRAIAAGDKDLWRLK